MWRCPRLPPGAGDRREGSARRRGGRAVQHPSHRSRAGAALSASVRALDAVSPVTVSSLSAAQQRVFQRHTQTDRHALTKPRAWRVIPLRHRAQPAPQLTFPVALPQGLVEFLKRGPLTQQELAAAAAAMRAANTIEGPDADLQARTEAA